MIVLLFVVLLLVVKCEIILLGCCDLVFFVGDGGVRRDCVVLIGGFVVFEVGVS